MCGSWETGGPFQASSDLAGHPGESPLPTPVATGMAESEGRTGRPRGSTTGPTRLPAHHRRGRVCKHRPESTGLLRTATSPTTGRRRGLHWINSVSSGLLHLRVFLSEAKS